MSAAAGKRASLVESIINPIQSDDLAMPSMTDRWRKWNRKITLRQNRRESKCHLVPIRLDYSELPSHCPAYILIHWFNRYSAKFNICVTVSELDRVRNLSISHVTILIKISILIKLCSLQRTPSSFVSHSHFRLRIRNATIHY